MGRFLVKAKCETPLKLGDRCELNFDDASHARNANEERLDVPDP